MQYSTKHRPSSNGHTTGNPLLDAALAYARKGQPVFPVEPKGKRPIGRLVPHGLRDATTDPEIIKRWWTEVPDANIGGPTGEISGTVVIDVDVKGDGYKSVEQLDDGSLLATLTVDTPSGGSHHIFRYPPGCDIRSSTGILPGVDVRANGGYIVLEPSHGPNGEYCKAFGSPSDPVPLPQSWFDLLTKPKTEPTNRITDPGDVAHNELLSSAMRYVAAAEGVTEGDRNATAFRLAGHVGAFQTENGKRLDETAIFDLLKIWNRKCQPLLPDRELRTIVKSALRNGEPREAKPVAPGPLRWRPFPIDGLPASLRPIVSDVAQSMGVDVSLLTMPMIATLAAAIGAKRRLRARSNWHAPPTLWTGVVAESGSGKTPPLKFATRPLVDAQTLVHDFTKGRNSPRYVVDDATFESLAPILVRNQHGLLYSRDELSGWFGSFDRYSGGKGGSDLGNWLSIYNAVSFVVDRKSQKDPLIVRNPHISVTGGIQPGVLRRAIGMVERESGLLARFLLAAPPRRQKRWSDSTDNPDAYRDYAAIVQGLVQLPWAGEPGDAKTLTLTPEALDQYRAFYDQHNGELVELSGDLAAAWSKLEECPLRLALVFQMVREQGDPLIDFTQPVDEHVDAESMRLALELTSWFKAETRRIYESLNATQHDDDRQSLIGWIEARGGRVTARELRRNGPTRFRVGDAAEQALGALASAGLGAWTYGEASRGRGRPTRVFALGACDDIPSAKGPCDENTKNTGKTGVSSHEA